MALHQMEKCRSLGAANDRLLVRLGQRDRIPVAFACLVEADRMRLRQEFGILSNPRWNLYPGDLAPGVKVEKCNYMARLVLLQDLRARDEDGRPLTGSEYPRKQCGIGNALRSRTRRRYVLGPGPAGGRAV